MRIALLIGVAALAAGCAGPYKEDRLRDAMDIFTAAVGVGFGAKARVGPAHAGFVLNLGSSGLRGGEWESVGGHGTLDLELFGLPFPTLRYGLVFSAEGTEGGYERGKDYGAIGGLPFLTTAMSPRDLSRFEGGTVTTARVAGTNPPYFTQVEVLFGLFRTVRIGFNPGELIDFILGWAGLDVFNDDLERKRQRGEEPD